MFGRIRQHDILDFCLNPKYEEMNWPDDYWPGNQKPTEAEWLSSIESFKVDRAKLQRLAADTKLDLFSKIPHGSGQTYFREIVLAADHAAYHVGQIVLLRKMLNVWKA